MLLLTSTGGTLCKIETFHVSRRNKRIFILFRVSLGPEHHVSQHPVRFAWPSVWIEFAIGFVLTWPTRGILRKGGKLIRRCGVAASFQRDNALSRRLVMYGII